jgi:hypothetical protein
MSLCYQLGTNIVKDKESYLHADSHIIFKRYKNYFP